MPKEEVRRRPLVPWQSVVTAFRPTDEPSEARLRTLRRNHVLSRGLHYPRHVGGHALGTWALYSSLNLEAAALYRRGREALAHDYRSAAQDLEEQWNVVLSGPGVPLAEVAGVAACGSLCASLLANFAEQEAKVRGLLPGVDFEDELRGSLAEWVDEWGRIEFVKDTLDGTLDLPRSMLEQAGIALGDPVVVVRELLPHGSAVLRVLPGVPLPAADGSERDEPLSAFALKALHPSQDAEFQRSVSARLSREEPIMQTPLRLLG